MRILSWNALGGDTLALAEALTANNIDLCVLQEAYVDRANAWYAPLQNLAATYGLLNGIVENQRIQGPNWSMPLFPADGQMRAYAVLWRRATLLKPTANLIDYTQDLFWGGARTPNRDKAVDEGYNQRPPLKIDVLPVAGGPGTTVFTWHAPTLHWNRWGLEMFEQSQTLANAIAPVGGVPGRTAIAGDLNNCNITHYFNGFNGLQAKNPLDYIIANTTFAKVIEIPGINLEAKPHWALAAEVTW